MARINLFKKLIQRIYHKIHKTRSKEKLISIRLTAVIAVALVTRLPQINWDYGFLFHPDERMLMFVTAGLKAFDNWNPNFFNYGSLPIYLLRFTADALNLLTGINFNNLSNLVLLARIMSTIADTITVIVIYKISFLIFKNIKAIKDTDFWASAAGLTYALFFFSIQNSHFFISDVFLTLFCALTVYLTLNNLNKSSSQKPSFYLLPVVWSAVLTTKISGIIFVAVSVVLIVFSLTYYYKNNPKFILIRLLFVFAVFTSSAFLFMPFAFLDYQKFLADTLTQIKMNSDAYIFPYTLQYVDTKPYLYYLKNIFYWGVGPLLSSFSFIGTILFLIYSFRKKNNKIRLKELVFLLFYTVFFALIGKSAVKFMRYMLPIYPFMAITAVFSFTAIVYKDKKFSVWAKYLFLIFIFFHTVFLSGFISIYQQPNTRLLASDWIHKNIPDNATLAVEHWDDLLPSYNSGRYNFEQLQIYDLPDNTRKWRVIEQQLKRSDYLILASNRLYTPLLKLSDCQKHIKCYPKTAEYYTQLFTTNKVFLPSESIEFQLAAEFANYPKWKIPFTQTQLVLNDQSADESFTVYDHPRIVIFKINK